MPQLSAVSSHVQMTQNTLPMHLHTVDKCSQTKHLPLKHQHKHLY